MTKNAVIKKHFGKTYIPAARKTNGKLVRKHASSDRIYFLDGETKSPLQARLTF